MYAIIKTGGKQYRVEKDGTVDVELLHVEDGSQVEFGEVLFFSDGSSTKFGAPGIEGFIVRGEVLGSVAGAKITSMKYKQRKRQYRRFGHRQHYSRVQILFIGSRDQDSEPKKQKEPKAKAEPKRKKKEVEHGA